MQKVDPSRAVLWCAVILLASCTAAAQTKRNQRPAAQPAEQVTAASAARTHFFEFERPGFIVSKIKIEHDDAGRGMIVFTREGYGEPITDPVQLSQATRKAIADALARMQFLDSKEVYQYSNEMPQMGQNTFTLRAGGRERTVTYNWTTHKDAKFLMDEYRRIGNEFVWRFELVVARENQPLQTPKLLTALELLVQRNEISDPSHLVPLLTELSEDERLPLIARNTALRIIKAVRKPTQ